MWSGRRESNPYDQLGRLVTHSGRSLQFAAVTRRYGLSTSRQCASTAASIRNETGVSVADSHIGAVIQSAHDDLITLVTSDPRDMRLVAGGKDITVAAI